MAFKTFKDNNYILTYKTSKHLVIIIISKLRGNPVNTYPDLLSFKFIQKS